MTKLKSTVLVLLVASTILTGGCLNWQRILLDTAIYAGTEFLMDNDAVFDLFPDGDTTATQ
jgi:hypothetical protein